jgi:hypothetical protein
MSLEKPNTIHLLSTAAQTQNDKQSTPVNVEPSVSSKPNQQSNSEKATPPSKTSEVSNYIGVISEYNTSNMDIQSIVSKSLSVNEPQSKNTTIALYYRINDTIIEVEQPTSKSDKLESSKPPKIQDITFELSRPSVYIDDKNTSEKEEKEETEEIIQQKYYPDHTLINKNNVDFSNIIEFKQTITDHMKAKVFLGENQDDLTPSGTEYMYTSMKEFAQEYINIINQYKTTSNSFGPDIPKFDDKIWKPLYIETVDRQRQDYITSVDNLIQKYNFSNYTNFKTVIEQIVNEPSVQSYLLLLLYYTNITSFKIVKKENKPSSAKQSENPEIEMFENFYKKLHENTDYTTNKNIYLSLSGSSLFPNNISYNRFVIQETIITSFLDNISNNAYNDNETNTENLPVYIIENNDKNVDINTLTPIKNISISYASQRKIVCYYAIFKFNIMDILLYTGLLKLNGMDYLKPCLKECVELIKNRKVNQTIGQDFFSFVFTPIIINKFQHVPTMIKTPHYIDWYNNAFHILAGTQKLGNIQNTTLVVERETKTSAKNYDLSILNQNVQHLLYKFKMNMTNYAEHMYNNYYILCLVRNDGVSYRFIQFYNTKITDTINHKIDYTFKIPSVVSQANTQPNNKSKLPYFQKYSNDKTQEYFKQIYQSQFAKVVDVPDKKNFINLPFRHAELIYTKYTNSSEPSNSVIIKEIYDKLTEIQALFTNNVFSNERQSKYKGLTHTSSIIKLNEIELLENVLSKNDETKPEAKELNESILFSADKETDIQPAKKLTYWNIVGDLILNWIDIYYTYEQRDHFGLLVGLKENLYNYVYTFKKYEFIFTLKLALRFLLTNKQNKQYNVSYICSDIEQIIEQQKPTHTPNVADDTQNDNNFSENALANKIQAVSIVSSNITDKDVYDTIDKLELFESDSNISNNDEASKPKLEKTLAEKETELAAKQNELAETKQQELAEKELVEKEKEKEQQQKTVAKSKQKAKSTKDSKSTENRETENREPTEIKNKIKELNDSIAKLKAEIATTTYNLNKINVSIQRKKENKEKTINTLKFVHKFVDSGINDALTSIIKGRETNPNKKPSYNESKVPNKDNTRIINWLSQSINSLSSETSPAESTGPSEDTAKENSNADTPNKIKMPGELIDDFSNVLDQLYLKTFNQGTTDVSSSEIDKTIQKSQQILEVVQKFRNNFQIFADSDEAEITKLFEVSVKAKTFMSRTAMGYLDQLKQTIPDKSTTSEPNTDKTEPLPNTVNAKDEFSLIASIMTKDGIKFEQETKKQLTENLNKKYDTSSGLLQLLQKIDDTFIGSTDTPYTFTPETGKSKKKSEKTANAETVTISETKSYGKLKTTIELINIIKGGFLTDDTAKEAPELLLEEYAGRIIQDIVSTIGEQSSDVQVDKSTTLKQNSATNKPFDQIDRIIKRLKSVQDILPPNDDAVNYTKIVNRDLTNLFTNTDNASPISIDLKSIATSTNLEKLIDTKLSDINKSIKFDKFTDKDILSNYYTLYLKWLLYKTECASIFTAKNKGNTSELTNLYKVVEFVGIKTINMEQINGINKVINRVKNAITSSFIKQLNNATFSNITNYPNVEQTQPQNVFKGKQRKIQSEISEKTVESVKNYLPDTLSKQTDKSNLIRKDAKDFFDKFLEKHFLQIELPKEKEDKPTTHEYFKNVVYGNFGLIPLMISSKLDKSQKQLSRIVASEKTDSKRLNRNKGYTTLIATPDIQGELILNVDASLAEDQNNAVGIKSTNALIQNTPLSSKVEIDINAKIPEIELNSEQPTIEKSPVLSYSHMIEYSKWLDKVMSQRILSTLDFYKAIPRQSEKDTSQVASQVVEQLEETMIGLDASEIDPSEE